MKKNVLFSLALASTLVLTFGTVQADEISDLEVQKKEKQETKNELQQDLNEVKTEMSALEEKIMSLNAEIEKNLSAIRTTEFNIAETEKNIKATQKQIKETKDELEIKKEILSENLRIMYSKGKVSYIEFLFRSDSMSDFIYRFNSLEDIAKANEQLYQEIKDLLLTLEEQEVLLLKQKESLLEDKDELTVLKKALEVRQNDQLDAMQKLEAQEYHISNEVSTQDEAISAINSEIAGVIRQREEARKKALESERRKKQSNSNNSSSSSSGSYGNEIEASGQFARPMKEGTYYLSSPYGWRTHPVNGTKKFHNGTDFAAGLGTPIYAADSGTVLFSGPANGYGNWIVIDHNNGYYTIYGHMYSNGLFVKPGQVVSKGQHIAAAGSAGTSTGNHLHFCVADSFNGSSFTYVDPMSLF